jgi:TonB-dependent SusC/RagA subfamily outer membrane receptor
MKSPLNFKSKFLRVSNKWSLFNHFAFVLLLMLITQSANFNVNAQNTGVTLNMKNVSIEDVLNAIETKTQYRFLYNKQMVDVNKKTSIAMANAEITNVLDEVFKSSEIAYSINAKQIVLSKQSNEQQKKITGLVTDQLGDPIIGATVLLKNSKIGTITNFLGSFTLEVEPNETLIVSYIGFISQEIKLNGQRNINVKLVEDVKSLSEIVVTALGIKREQKALGYAVQAVDGGTLQTVKGVDMASSLTGRVAGLMVKNSTEFTAEATLTLRGETPLLVVDGVPFKNMSLRDIPSDDIENISVLKGGTATALYGESGDGGAIMVTTKKGTAKKGLSVTINSGTMFSAGYLAIPELQSTYGRVVTTATNSYIRTADGSWGVPMEG